MELNVVYVTEKSHFKHFSTFKSTSNIVLLFNKSFNIVN